MNKKPDTPDRELKKKMEITKKDAVRENKKLQKLRQPIKERLKEKDGEKIREGKKDTPKQATLDKIEFEPIIHDGEPIWLQIKTRMICPVIPGRTAKQMAEDPLDPEIDVTFSTKPQGLWKCKKCGVIIESNPEEPFECYEDQGGCGRKSSFEVITGKINTKRWKLPHWKDIPQENISMITTFDDLKDILKRCIIFPEEIYYDIFALWIVASYKRESFNAISFLMFIGLVESGKSRGLDLLRELGYQMIHTLGVTFPCMCRYTNNHHAGILIDEIDNKTDKRTEDGRRYLDFLKPSYRRGSIYATADKENQEATREYDTYGFKAFAGERGGSDYAFLSRCIIFKMEQEDPEVPELEYIQDELNEMQNTLLNYRYKFNNPIRLPIDFPLKGRDREIFGCLIQTAQHIGMKYDHITDFIRERKQEIIEDLQETNEYLILKAIYSAETKETLIDAPEVLSYADIAEDCGWDFDTDEGKKKRQRIGFILHKKFHLKTKRVGSGMVLLLNDEKNKRKIKNYYKRYRIMS